MMLHLHPCCPCTRGTAVVCIGKTTRVSCACCCSSSSGPLVPCMVSVQWWLVLPSSPKEQLSTNCHLVDGCLEGVPLADVLTADQLLCQLKAHTSLVSPVPAGWHSLAKMYALHTQQSIRHQMCLWWVKIDKSMEHGAYRYLYMYILYGLAFYKHFDCKLPVITHFYHLWHFVWMW